MRICFLFMLLIPALLFAQSNEELISKADGYIMDSNTKAAAETLEKILKKDKFYGPAIHRLLDIYVFNMPEKAEKLLQSSLKNLDKIELKDKREFYYLAAQIYKEKDPEKHSTFMLKADEYPYVSIYYNMLKDLHAAYDYQYRIALRDKDVNKALKMLEKCLIYGEPENYQYHKEALTYAASRPELKLLSIYFYYGRDYINFYEPKSVEKKGNIVKAKVVEYYHFGRDAGKLCEYMYEFDFNKYESRVLSAYIRQPDGYEIKIDEPSGWANSGENDILIKNVLNIK